MANTKAISNSFSNLLKQKVADYKMLVKFRLSMLVVFAAGSAFLMGAGSAINWTAFVVICVAGFLITGAANTLNQVIEKDFDLLMERTKNRPIPAGRMQVSEAVLAAGLMSVVGILMLSFFFNPIVSLIGMFSLLSYAFIYTPMKRVSPAAVWIGAVPGALPMMIGWVAATGEVGVEAWVLFLIQFLWQFPHFWAIAWVAFDDYSKGGYYLLPSKGGRDKASALQCFVYALAIIPVGLFPYMLGLSGIISAIVLVTLGIGYSYYGWKLYQNCTAEAAKKLMFFSFLYLPVALIILLIDLI